MLISPSDEAALDLSACHREPIHTPGSIQPHGALLAANADDLTITHLSANFARSTGIASRSALRAPLAAIIGAEATGRILEALGNARYSLANVLTLDLPFAREPRRDVVAHAHDGRIVLELEPASPPREHTHVVSRVQAIIAALRQTKTVADLCDGAASAMRALTGYDRVMVYQFDPSGHGEIVAEDKRSDLEPYLNLRYPASDIPDQARRLYFEQRVRVIVDVDRQPIAILTDPGLEAVRPLDMSYCALRGVSPVHLEYLGNMGVRATLTISLLRDDVLWGMIVCHHLAPRAVSTDLRALCDLFGQLVALLIGAVGERDTLSRRVARNETLTAIKQAVDSATGVAAGLEASAEALMRLVDATGVAIRVSGRLQLFGHTPSPERAEALIDDLLRQARDEIVATDRLGHVLPHHEPESGTASGVLALPISANPGDVIAWFRPELTRTVSWGGNPNKAVQVDGESGRISPRQSFAAWRELLRGTATPWSLAETRIVRELRGIVTDGMLRHAEAQLVRLSTIDPLTGLANRRLLEDILLAWARSEPRPDASLLFFDIDRFKSLNDTLGHAAGDALLVQVARRFVAAAPADCLVARLGGDEFVVFAPGHAPARAVAIANDLIAAIATPFEVLGRAHRASGSFGVAHSGPGRGDLLQEADVAMYAAKRQGGGRVVIFEDTLHRTALEALHIEQDLFLALQRDEFALQYQPVFDLKDGALSGFEALVRWRHPTRGLVAPADFIGVAEATGSIGALGRWIMETGIAELAGWRNDDLRVAINVSPRQLGTDEFVTALEAALKRHALAPDRLVLEVTESVLMDTQAVMRLQRLRDLGCKIAIDDFGTGYSSLAYLSRLPIDVIKIDRGFVTPLGQDAKADRFFETLVDLIHTFGLFVIAEGVETERQLRVVKQTGCDACQGYLLSRPLDPDGARAMIAARAAGDRR